jgi:ankyrin repeat protein
MLRAAATGRWSAIPLLVELGFPVNGTNGRSALHHAAADGRLDLVRQLIDLGADLHAKDSIYNSTPLQWAEYFKRSEMADYLRPLTT